MTSSGSIPLSEAISSLALFHGMESDLLHGIIASARETHFEKGAVFLEQGQPITRFYIILEGWCGASKVNSEGQESILQIFQRGDFLPETDSDVYGKLSPLNLQALTHVRVVMLSPSLIRSSMMNSKPFMANLLLAFVRRSQELRDHIEHLTLLDAEQRVGRFLLQMRFNTDAAGKEIILPFDKSLIASYLGIKAETLSRTLQSFKEKGFVIERNHLQVPDRQALCDYCDQATAHACRFSHLPECPNPVVENANNAVR